MSHINFKHYLLTLNFLNIIPTSLIMIFSCQINNNNLTNFGLKNYKLNLQLFKENI